jgi:hypothetical protein
MAFAPSAETGGMNVLPSSIARRPLIPWPLPALATWLCAWGLWRILADGPLPAAPLAAAGGALMAIVWPRLSSMRRLLLAAGFPLVALVLAPSSAASAWPAWYWLLPLLPLLLAYPLRAWRDAPLFPTPPDALQGVPALVQLPGGARLLDAGCGLGHGLDALHRAFPDAQCEGIETSWPLRLAAAWRCRRHASVRQGDMWRADWSAYDLVYLFQRPESMQRAHDKARAEMRAGRWMASLEFQVPDVEPTARWCAPGGRTVWLYRLDGGGSTPSRLRR